MTLPVSSEVHGLSALHRQRRYAAHLIAIRDGAVIFPPLRFLRIAEEIRPGDVVVNADFGPTEPSVNPSLYSAAVP